MKQTGTNKDSGRLEPNNSTYLEHDGKFAVYVFFTKKELQILRSRAGKGTIPGYIQKLILDEIAGGREGQDVWE